MLMDYYDKLENVEAYIEMAKGTEATMLIDLLKEHLTEGSSILELGMGPGNDFRLLAPFYEITGSDKYRHFVDLFKIDNPEADVLVLDAVTLETEATYDCIYSNKVLMHLTKEELQQSFKKQLQLLNEGGILFHTFWRGEDKEYHGGMLNQYYTEKMLAYEIGEGFDIVLLASYGEFEEDDSIVMILKKTSPQTLENHNRWFRRR